MTVENNPALLKFFSNKFRWAQHLIFWIVYFLDSSGLLLFYNYEDESLLNTFAVFGVDIILIYTNIYWLLPKFLMKNKFASYIGLTVLFLLVDIGLGDIIEYSIFYNPEYYQNYTFADLVTSNILNLQITAFFLGTAIGLKMFKLWLSNQQRIRQLETLNLQTELNYLKSQINPHFLFNTLNNIYVQTRIDQNSAAQTILKLSDLLRFQLYECSKDKVTLASDIEYIKNYLELEKIRKTNANVNFQIEGTANGKMISPFIFIPFVENAVKHGLNSSGNENYVNIFMKIDSESIIFEVENSYNIQPTKSADGGLGLANIKRRLELLFPGKYDLIIYDNGLIFKVTLTLNLKV
ncbi:MAG: histidine kinase [Bacteroidota bacterium]